MAKTVVRTSGFRELEEALGELPKALQKPVLRRVAKKVLEPMRSKAASLAADAPPYGEGLSASIKISSVLAPTARAEYRREGPSQVFMHMGPGPGSAKAVVNEFGSYKMHPTPYMRPAWDSEAEPTLDRIKVTLGAEIMKSALRAQRKAARRAGA